MKERNLRQKAQVMACKNALDTQFGTSSLIVFLMDLATMNMAQAMKMTSATVKQINGMMNVKQLQRTGMELQKNMMQMGMITEMMEETMEQDDDIEEEADDVINNIITNIEIGKFDEQDPLGVPFPVAFVLIFILDKNHGR